MDLQQLIASQDEPATKARSAPDERAAAAAAIKRPIELQQAQADRVKGRIDSLEKTKADLIASIDAELAELNGELASRRDRIETDTKAQAALAKQAAAAAAAVLKADNDLGAAAEAVADPPAPKEKKKKK